jgi:hypothetical protein
VVRISYSLQQTTNISLKIFDVTGVCVKTLINNVQQAGNYFIDFDSVALNTGVYLCVLKLENKTITTKIIKNT